MVAKYLNISIKDIEESLKDGVILCQLLNEMKKNAVRKIMMPQGEEKLSTMKSTVNLNSFLRFVQINLGKVSHGLVPVHISGMLLDSVLC